MNDYPQRPERAVNIGDFYRLNGRTTFNSDPEYWREVARQAVIREKQRAMAARRVAKYVQLVIQTAADRDESLRKQIEYWKTEAEKARIR